MLFNEDLYRCRVSEDITAGFYNLTVHRVQVNYSSLSALRVLTILKVQSYLPRKTTPTPLLPT